MAAHEQTRPRRRGHFRSEARNFWATDRSLTLLVVLVVGNIFIMPLAHFATWGRFMARGALSLMLISGLLATVRDRVIVALTIAFVLSGFVIGGEALAHPNLILDLVNDLVSLLSLALLVALIFRQVFRAGAITLRRIQGSVALYMLLGFFWAVCYEMVELLAPGSFRVGAAHGAVNLSDLSYFSFTTLTTLGLGDVLPLGPAGRSLVVLEALTGQLFPVILIARLVTMEVDYRRTEAN